MCVVSARLETCVCVVSARQETCVYMPDSARQRRVCPPHHVACFQSSVPACTFAYRTRSKRCAQQLLPLCHFVRSFLEAERASRLSFSNEAQFLLTSSASMGEVHSSRPYRASTCIHIHTHTHGCGQQLRQCVLVIRPKMCQHS